MRRAFALLALLFLGCTTTGEPLALVRPLPDDAGAQPFAELLRRGRAQGIAATEALYIEDWAEADEAGKALEQTARFLNKATDVPDDKKDNLPALSGDLGEDASKFRTLVKAKDGDRANEVLARINFKLRKLSPKK
jgi:hypothetical protein